MVKKFLKSKFALIVLLGCLLITKAEVPRMLDYMQHVKSVNSSDTTKKSVITPIDTTIKSDDDTSNRLMFIKKNVKINRLSKYMNCCDFD